MAGLNLRYWVLRSMKSMVPFTTNHAGSKYTNDDASCVQHRARRIPAWAASVIEQA
jgi:hypothetical protein